MIVATSFEDVPAGGGPMRTFVARPSGGGRHPGVLFYSDIFQLTGPMLRSCVRLAGHGFVVAAPEIYSRIEAPGAAIAFDDAGRMRGMENAARTTVADFDADCRSALDFLSRHTAVEAGRIGAAGFCIGGHLAFRAAFQSEVKGTVCFYGTGIHNGRLGMDADAGSLRRAPEVRGRMLLVWGTNDPHVPREGRDAVAQALRTAGVSFEERSYAAEHAFMRDEGPRFDPEATDQAFAEAVAFLRSTL